VKILFVHLCAPYMNEWTYRENLLPKYLSNFGNEVLIVTNFDTIDIDNDLIISGDINVNSPQNENVKRLNYKKFFLPRAIYSRLRYYNGLLDVMISFQPDLVYVNSLQFGDLDVIRKFSKLNPKIKIFGELNATFINSARNVFSKQLLHGIFYRNLIKKNLEIFDKIFYGSSIAAEFSSQTYNIDNNYEILPLGVDNILIKDILSSNSSDLRTKHNIAKDDFVIVTGGKLSKNKNLDAYIKSIQMLNDDNSMISYKLKFIIFGSFSDKDLNFNGLQDSYGIVFLGWLNSIEMYEILKLSNLAVFPGGKSAIWESAVAVGLPILAQYWEGNEYLDFNGNISYLRENGNPIEISNEIKSLILNRKRLSTMAKISKENGLKDLSYEQIAKRILSEAGEKYNL